MLDTLDYPELFHDNSLSLFFDFYKALDTQKHPFTFEALHRFHFDKK